MFNSFARTRSFRLRFTLARVGVCMCIGPFCLFWEWGNGVATPTGSKPFVKQTAWKLIRRGRLTLRRYYVLRAPATERQEKPVRSSAERSPGRTR